MSAPPKKPSVDIEYYEQPKVIGYFESIIDSLRIELDKAGCDTHITTPDLGYFTAHFQKFQLHHLKKQHETYIPFAYFNVISLSTQSPLYHILKSAYRFKSERQIVDWRWDAPEETETYLHMIQVIKEDLDKAGFELCKPRVWFHETSAEEQKKKRHHYSNHQGQLNHWYALVEQLGGIVVDTMEEATFIVYHQEQTFDRYHRNWRMLHQTDEEAMVHWIGLPDSYNTLVKLNQCVPDKEETVDLAEDKQCAPWHVKSNWIDDSAKYNEWMSPLDYVISAQQSLKRKLVVMEETNNKKVKTAEEQKQKTWAMARQYMPIQQYEVIIPSYAAWFDLETIHPIETKGLPEFFNQKNKSKTPSIYKEYRDIMINTYRLNPVEYLTVTACRRNMAGDVCAIIRVHGFLEQWGLINYQMDPSAKPTAIGPPLEGQVKVVAEFPKGMAYPSSPPSTPPSTTATPSATTITDTPSSPPTATPSITPSLETTKTPSNIELNLDLRQDIYKKNISCHVCKKEKKKGYMSTKQFICDDCYQPEQHKEFTKRLTPWTDQEDMLLLEGLEMFSEDWQKIAEHVGTKTRDECILHYLQLPLLDPIYATDQHQHTEMENPIMSVVAFLAANVKPKVAASILASDETIEDQQEKEDIEEDTHEEKFRLIRTKMEAYSARISQFEKLEGWVDSEKRQLERGRCLIQSQHVAIRKQIDEIRHLMFQKQQPQLQEQPQLQDGHSS
ncbi:hypothetical protein EDC96DRAFT_324382 [Choanephora cucurbitarum]|nr:hypothetical protein EDC96DRAFT_324382 [Choanephora cucurbitarum]